VVQVAEIIVPQQITVRELAEKMRRSPIDIIKTLMNYGMMVPITESIDFGTAAVVGEELGIAVKPEALPEPEVVEVEEKAPLTLRQRILADEKPEELVIRPPIVTVLGHVDHGKTTLLDAIRETRVVEGEAGGITQHIGAYQIELKDRKITFLDTPGHEAFTAMRARGAMVTDIAILVVAADDGVMPQTKEAISHVRAAQVPIIVALNKIDKPQANPDRVKQELADNGLLIEEYGGDVMCVPVSAKFRRGIDDLLESILLVADVDPLMANPKGHTVGTVIESRLDKTRGSTATLLVQNGTLRVGDSVVSGETYGKLRAMYDDKGRPITQAPPATPVIVLGMADVPVAGDTFSVQSDEKTARSIAAERQLQRRAETAVAAPKALTLDSIFAQAESGQVKELNLILKADVQGSIEPIVNSLEKLGSDKLRVKILHQATGNVTESDVMLAVASSAIIMGFSVNVEPTAARMADAEGVDIRLYDIIYKLVEDIERALTGLLEPVYKEVITGHAEVRAVFRVSKVGKVAGCYILDGEVHRGALARVKREGVVLAEDRITGLKRFQEDVTEVKTSFECGISLGNYNEYEEGDIFEVYKKERVS
jgi:translation initiation factor IF-2